MDKTRRAIVAALIATSAIAWIASIQQPDMMVAMTSYNPLAIALFTASWTAGMAAMMFPAITPMVLLYNTFVASKEIKGSESSTTLQQEDKPKSSIRSLRVILFIGCYLLVWALTGIALLLGWSVVMNNTIMTAGSSQLLPNIYGGLLIVAGAYQFTPLKRTCIGFCESPLSFFMRRWRAGTSGAVKMGLYHGMYCLGCCWAYFLLMVALGWMNLLWMGLFAGIIFGEKIWSRGIWVARAAGVGLTIVGILVIAGMLPSLVSASTMSPINDNSVPMSMSDEGGGGDMAMNDNVPKSSTSMSGESEAQGNNDESPETTSGDDGQSMQSMESGNSGDMSDMKTK